jgi:hypothetical protein
VSVSDAELDWTDAVGSAQEAASALLSATATPEEAGTYLESYAAVEDASRAMAGALAQLHVRHERLGRFEEYR